MVTTGTPFPLDEALYEPADCRSKYSLHGIISAPTFVNIEDEVEGAGDLSGPEPHLVVPHAVLLILEHPVLQIRIPIT